VDVVRLRALDEVAGLAEAWNRLSGGVPFRSWEWNGTWWRHYCDDGQLYVLCVRDGQQLVAVAPWYVSRHPARGRVVRFLAAGEVCTDYQTVLCLPGREAEASAAVADWLLAAAGQGSRHTPRAVSSKEDSLVKTVASRDDGWDLLDFSGIEAADVPMRLLLEALAARRCQVHREAGLNCWRLDLPPTWEEYLAQLSKSHRGQVTRRVRKYFDSGRAVWHTVSHPDQLPEAFELLVVLHHRRWEHVGQPGLFDSPRYAAFHRDVAGRMLATGQLRLHWLTLDGRPAAAEYHFAGAGVSYLYQGGMEPELFSDNPGNLAHVAAIRGAMADGYQAMDFLRGDEPYKKHFRAEPQACWDVRVVPPRVSSRLRNGAWQAGRRVKRWLTRASSPLPGARPAAGSEKPSAAQHTENASDHG
jgi:CelD/BcsL family acetyltransferase involved in cellulose biosynthesis